MDQAIKGHDVVAALATRFPQLYVSPSEGAQELHRLAARRGVVAPDARLDHFVTSEDDELREVQTPAGPVEVVFLRERADFETFLQIVGHKAQPTPIAPTVGAITYRGLADWGKVAAARTAYLAEGGQDWSQEFGRLARTPGAFRTELVVISEGPYSNIDSRKTPFAPDEWLRVSREIRLHHECAHVVCRRMMPDDVLPVWDEVTADVVGLLCATGAYDAALATRFLGVTEAGFVGGRLVEYLSEEQRTCIDAIAVAVYRSCEQIARLCGSQETADPFSFLLNLKRTPLLDQ